jgi:hypothetical protein
MFFKKNQISPTDWIMPITALLLFALTVGSFFPGELTLDSISQLNQAQTGIYLDQHPPVMAGLWRFLMVLWKDPGVFFVFQNLCFWSFWAGLAYITFKDLRSRLCFLLLGTLPSVWCQLIVVWKDSGESIALVGAVFLTILYKKFQDPKNDRMAFQKGVCLTLLILLIFYASALRWNSLPAILPLVWFFFKKKNGPVFSFHLSLTVLLFLVLQYSFNNYFNYRFLKTQKCYISQVLLVSDILSVYTKTGREEFFPGYWRNMNPGLSLEDLRNYDPSDDSLSQGSIPLNLTSNSEQLQELKIKWLQTIWTFPNIYLEHRWQFFKKFLRIGENGSYFPFQLRMVPSVYAAKEMGNREIRLGLKYYFWLFGNSVFFKGWFYLLFLTGVLGAHVRLRSWSGSVVREASFWAALSALFYALGYFFYAPAFDFRFLYPTVVLSFLSFALLFSKPNSGLLSE